MCNGSDQKVLQDTLNDVMDIINDRLNFYKGMADDALRFNHEDEAEVMTRNYNVVRDIYSALVALQDRKEGNK